MKCGREAKARRANTSNDTISNNPEGLHSLFVLEAEALDTDSELVDPSFDPDISMTSDTEHLLEETVKQYKKTIQSHRRISEKQ